MPRLSLTPKQLETPVGAELLNICQSVTDDGNLSDEDVKALDDWFRDNPASDLPAHTHLNTILAQVLKDGRVTPVERRALYQAIETIMPADLRPLVRLKRLDREEAERQAAKEAQTAAREAEQAEMALNDPLDHVNFMVAGVRHEGRAALVARHVREGDVVHLHRDVANRHSEYAIGVWTGDGHMVGYVPEDEAADIAPLLDRGGAYYAVFAKVLRGGAVPVPVVDASIYSAAATLPSLIRDALDSRTAPPAHAKVGSITASLTPCPDCGREVSSKAPTCPNCGAPLAGESLVHGKGDGLFMSSLNCGCMIVLGLVLVSILVMVFS
jgi:hypothetical protein